MKTACHITSVHNRYDIRIFRKECIHLVKAGWTVYLLVNDNKEEEIVNGVNIVPVHLQTKNRIQRMLQAPKRMLECAKIIDADIYHIHDPELLPLAKKLHACNKEVVFDSHEFTAEQIRTKQYIPKVFRDIAAWMYKQYESRVLKCVSGVISACPYNGMDYFRDINKNRVYINNFPVCEEILELELNRIKKKKQICYVGSISEARGIIPMIKAAGIAEVPLILAGRFSSCNLKEQVESMPEYKYVDYRGELSHSEIIQVLQESMVGISVLQETGQYPYLYNLPTKVYEYMMIGIPTVISDFKYVETILRKYCFGIAVNPSDERSIANAIVAILHNEEMAKSMGEEGKKAIQEELNWELESKKLDAFYRQIVEYK